MLTKKKFFLFFKVQKGNYGYFTINMVRKNSNGSKMAFLLFFFTLNSLSYLLVQ